MQEKPRVLPVVWLLLAVLAMAALHWLLPVVQVLRPPWSLAGLAPMALGLWMAAVSAHSFQRAKTGLIPFDEATTLVTGGFFRYSRNPMYLGMVLFLAGLALVLGSISTVAPIPAFTWIIQHQFIRAEESFMENAFGAAYLDYKSRVRRWL